MDTVTGFLLGIIQGLTEFLPISSFGHLVLFQNLFGLTEPVLLFDTSLHLGTLVAVCVYFRSDLKQMILETFKFIIGLIQGRRSWKGISEVPHVSLALWVLVGTIPTALIGLIFRSSLEKLFSSITWVGIMLVFTGLILAITRIMPKGYTGRSSIGPLTALAVGTAQGLALIPGISRSGTTIVCGMLFKVERELAARFSFLLSIPAIIGALLLQLDAEGVNEVGILPLFIGFVTSILVGLLALRILMGMVRKGNLYYFAPYCWAVGLFILTLRLF
jgi:undecaprenyl-diphosphatase